MSERTTIYIAGPMTGVEDLNYPLFNEVAGKLRAEGYNVFNPAELDGGPQDSTGDGSLLAEFMVRDLPYVIAADVIALLPNWRESRGANLELLTARICGKEVWEALPNDDETAVFFYASEVMPDLFKVTNHIEETNA